MEFLKTVPVLVASIAKPTFLVEVARHDGVERWNMAEVRSDHRDVDGCLYVRVRPYQPRRLRRSAAANIAVIAGADSTRFDERE
jgi:hypothetical protein